MPLRLRLIALVVFTLSASLALGGAVTLINASRSVRVEMLSAMQVGRQTVDNVLRGSRRLGGSAPRSPAISSPRSGAIATCASR